MTLSTKTLRCVAIVAAIVTVCMRASRAWGQDAPMHVSCQVAKLTANGKTYSQVQYAVFKSMKRAVKVKNDIVTAVAAENALGATGAEIDNALASSGATWKDSRPNGTFDLSAMSGQAVVVFCDRGQERYELTVRMRRSLRDVVVEGQRRLFRPTFKKVPSMDTGYETQFSVNVVLPEGWTRDDSRLIIQPMAIDCQTEDTIAYLPAMVYEGGDIIDTFVYRLGMFGDRQVDVASAVNLAKSFITILLVGGSYLFAYKKFDYKIF